MRMQTIARIIDEADSRRLIAIATAKVRPSVDLFFETDHITGKPVLVQTEIWSVNSFSVNQLPCHPERISLDGYVFNLDKNELLCGDYIFVTRAPYRILIAVWREEDLESEIAQ